MSLTATYFGRALLFTPCSFSFSYSFSTPEGKYWSDGHLFSPCQPTDEALLAFSSPCFSQLLICFKQQFNRGAERTAALPQLWLSRPSPTSFPNPLRRRWPLLNSLAGIWTTAPSRDAPSRVWRRRQRQRRRRSHFREISCEQRISKHMCLHGWEFLPSRRARKKKRGKF